MLCLEFMNLLCWSFFREVMIAGNVFPSRNLNHFKRENKFTENKYFAKSERVYNPYLKPCEKCTALILARILLRRSYVNEEIWFVENCREYV